MPTSEEKLFFVTAFHFSDTQDGTNWRSKYEALIKNSPDGKIDWKQIPGFLPPRVFGYIPAIKQICKTIISIKQRNPGSTSVKTTYKLLVKLSKKVYDQRRINQDSVQRSNGLFTYIFFQLSLFTSFQDDATRKHEVAAKVWKQAWTTLQKENYLSEKSLWDILLSLTGLDM